MTPYRDLVNIAVGYTIEPLMRSDDRNRFLTSYVSRSDGNHSRMISTTMFLFST